MQPILIGLLLSIFCQTTPPPRRIDNTSNFKVSAWNGVLCSPRFTYRFDADGISVTYQDDLIENLPDTNNVFSILKKNAPLLRRISHRKRAPGCLVLDDPGIGISVNDEQFGLAGSTFLCVHLKPKEKQQLKVLRGSLLGVIRNFEEKRIQQTDIRFNRNCNQ